MTNIQASYILFFSLFLFTACQSKPKVVEHEPETNQQNSLPSQAAESSTHKVKVNEVLHSSKYTYLNVDEEGNSFWIAVPGQEVEEGQTYYYKGGLKKVNFESKEFNRVFDVIYLVSRISKQPGFAGGSAVERAMANMEKKETVEDNSMPEPVEGGIRIADLFANQQKYAGKTIIVSGKCVKVNNQIMGKNWVHVQDGSGQGGNADLTITTQEIVMVGSNVTFEGTIALNKDFGAGYRYDVIMEQASLK